MPDPRGRLMSAHGLHRWTRARVLLLSLVVALLGVGLEAALPAQAQSSSQALRDARAERDRLQAELDVALEGVSDERDDLLDIQSRLDAALGLLRVAEGQLALAEQALATAELRADVADQELAIATRLLEQAETDLRREQDEFTIQIVTAYKYGHAVRGEMILTMMASSESPGDLTRNLYRIGAVLEHQDSVLERMTALRDEQVEAEEEAVAARAAADEAKGEAEVELAFVADRRADAEALRVQIADEERAQKRILDRAAAGANELSARLQEAIRRVERLEAEERRRQVAARGGVLCPIDPVWFSNDWGYPRSGGRTHKGNDLFADQGTPIVAITDGTVRRLDRTDTYVPGANRGDLGGISISYWVDSNEYWYFAHLESLEPGLLEGQQIRAGQVVGYVGTSGNAYNTPPHAHVGRFVNGGAVNPYPTLAPACGK